jgi:hypothetical protein
MVPRFGGEKLYSLLFYSIRAQSRLEMEYSKSMNSNELAILVAMELMVKAGLGDASEHPDEWALGDPNSQLSLHIAMVGDVISIIDKLGYIKDLEPTEYDETL